MSNLQITFGIMLVFFVAFTVLYLVNDLHNSQDNFYYKVQKQINPDKGTILEHRYKLSIHIQNF